MKEFSGLCYMCNRPITWTEGHAPCCDDCAPVRERNQADLSSRVQRLKEREKQRKAAQAAGGGF